MAVRGISFDIPERQIVAMLGSNGASKTTMMKVLTGYLAPSEGSAAIGGYGVLPERMPAATDAGGPRQYIDNISILYRLTFVGTKC